ncbi:MAG TPA: pyrroline-5-carboxylate reductase [Tepiditoga sp.]|nr:pyrroline-5-carboxylate reductase [Tepiditoga sp.]
MKITDKIGIIGFGNMGSAIIKGLTETESVYPENITLSDKEKNKTLDFLRNYPLINFSSNTENAKNSKYLIIAVKPHQYNSVLNEIKEFINENTVIISIAAGITISDLKYVLGNSVKTVRTMPNTPAMINEGMTAVSFDVNITDSERDTVLNIFNSIGKTEVFEEKFMDFIPALSGSSPAYVFMMIEAMADAAVLSGISRDKAYKMAAQSILGAAKLFLNSGKHPGELKDMVCSPGGTTIEAVSVLEENGFRSSVIKAMNACSEKAVKMSRNK